MQSQYQFIKVNLTVHQAGTGITIVIIIILIMDAHHQHIDGGVLVAGGDGRPPLSTPRSLPLW